MALKAIQAAVDVMREARSTLELKGQVTGELKGQGEAIERAVVVIPAVVPVGSPANLQARLPPDAVQRALAGAEGGAEVIDVEAVTPPEGPAQIPGPKAAEAAGPHT